MLTYLRFQLHLQNHGPTRTAAAGHGDGGPSLTAARLRRMLGMSWVRRFCPFGEPRCEAREPKGLRRSERCHLLGSCPYGTLLATDYGERPKLGLHVPSTTRGRRASIELSLFGEGWRHYGWLLDTTQRVLRRGLGHRRVRWSIEGIRRIDPEGRQHPVVEGGDLSTLSPTLSPDVLGLVVEPFLSPQPVAIDWRSPARLARDGKVIRRSAAPFEILVARILDRVEGLYGDGVSDLLRPAIRDPVLEAAARVEILDDRTRWVEVVDYSSRQRRETRKGGRVGRTVYGPEAARFFPILRAGTVLQVGKNAGSGCGRFDVELLPAA